MATIAIYGAGAIGGYLGAKLALAGSAVSLVARGPHLAAIRMNGLILMEGEETHTIQVAATDEAAEIGPQDFVIVALKAHSIPAALPGLQKLLGPKTAVVFAVNGIPWWYFYGLGGAYEGRRVASVDPEGEIWNSIGPQRAIGCVVYPACDIAEPGIIRHANGNRFSLGEPDGERSDRIVELASILIEAGLKAPIRPRLRDEIWIKIWGNASLNPISVLTGGTLAEMTNDPDTRQVIATLMGEIQNIGEALGGRFLVNIDRRIAGAQAVGDHRTSMLQDYQFGRPMEIDALVGAVSELGKLVDVPSPNLDLILALVRQRARLAGCYL